MSSEILSQNDIDQLLGDPASPGPGAASRGRAGGQPVLYDFRRPHRVSKERLRTLEAMYERLVKSMEGWILGRVRGQVEMTLQGVEQLSFGEFALSLPTPCCAYLVDIHDSGGQQGVIDFGQDFAYFLVDRLLGGRGDPLRVERVLTPIERQVVRTVAERVTHTLREVWEDYIEMEFGVSGFESIPEILRATSGDDPVLVASVNVTAGGTQTVLSICLPFGVLDTFFADSGAYRRHSVTGSEQERSVYRRMVEGNLRSTSVPVAVRLPSFRISVRDLMALREGMVLDTGVGCEAEAEVLVSGEHRFMGTAARVGRKLAVRLESELALETGPAAAVEPGVDAPARLAPEPELKALPTINEQEHE